MLEEVCVGLLSVGIVRKVGGGLDRNRRVESWDYSPRGKSTPHVCRMFNEISKKTKKEEKPYFFSWFTYW